MTQTPDSAAAHVVIVGGGFGGLAAAKALAGAAVQVTLVDRLNYHLFQPLLYQVALASLSATDIAAPIRSILRRQRNVEVLLGDVVGFDLDRRCVRLDHGGELPYGYLIVAAGARTHYYGHDEWAGFAPGLKDLDDALEVRRRVLSALEAAERTRDSTERARLLTFVVIGGGPTGVELAGALANLSRDILEKDFRNVRHRDTRVVLLEAGPRILTPFDEGLAQEAERQLGELGVDVRVGTRVTRIDERGVWTGKGTTGEEDLLSSATVLWGAGVTPSPLAKSLVAALDHAGRVVVGQDSSLPGHREVFVIGDMAAFTPPGESKPLPGISPVAIQQGRAVARNIQNDLRKKPRADFAYFDKGFMATIGRARAVAVLRRLRLSGLPAWLAWVFVHIYYLIGFRNRVMVFINWVWSYVMLKHGARLITGGKR